MAINLRDSYSKVTWDLGSKKMKAEPWGKTDDTGRGIIVTIAQDSVIITPTTETLRMYFLKPDGTDGYIPSTIVNNKFIIENMSQVFAVPGKVNAELEFNDGTEFIKSISFTIDVYESQQSSNIVSSNDYSALQEAFGKVSNLETTYAPRLGSVESQLADNTNKHKHIVYIEDFGGKVNDSNFDNSTSLNNAITYLLNNRGGVIQLLEGTYEFKTAIVIDVPFSVIKLQGVGIWNEVRGTKVNWSGSGYFLTLNQGGQYYEIKDLYIKCNSNYGLSLNKGTQTNFKSRIKDLFIMNALRSIDINDFAYMFAENIIIGSSDVNTQYGMRINSQGTGEFLYLNGCSIDGYDTSNGNGIIINKGSNIYINNCDIANWGSGTGILIETDSSTTIQVISIRDLNIIRCDGGCQIKATNAPITQITIDNPCIIFRGILSTEKGIETFRSSTHTISGLNLKNLNFRRIGGINPSSIVVINDNTTQGCLVEVNSNLTTGTAKMADSGFYKATLFDHNSTLFEKTFSFTGNGTTKSFTCIISSNSIFRGGAPMIQVITNQTIAYGISDLGNSYGGNLFCTVNFATAPVNGASIKIYVSTGHKCIS